MIFWKKKKKELELPEPRGLPEELEKLKPSPLAEEEKLGKPIAPPMPFERAPAKEDKLELILSKLETIDARLRVIEEKLKRLE